MAPNNQKDRTLLLTGASRGIGHATVKRFSAAGWRVITCSRHAFPENCPWEAGPEDHIQVDLANPENTIAAIAEIKQRLNGELHALVNNAGFGAFGYIHEIPEARMLEMIQVNCSAVVQLTRLYVPGMVERRHGDVLIVASVAGFQAVPYNSVYAATKAFDLIFAEGIAEEVGEFGVRVCALCPGSTETEFQGVAQQPDRVFRSAETAEKVARVGLEGLAAGKSSVISGAKNALMMAGERLAPRRFVARMAAKMMRPSES